MTKEKTAFIVLCAGMGTRMKSQKPKVMHPLAGHPMVSHVLDTARELAPEKVIAVIGDAMDDVAAAVSPHPTAVQRDRLGTAHAVLAARDVLGDFDGDVVVLYGDTPLITAETLQRLLAARRSANDPAVAVLGFRSAQPGAYGRLVTDAEGGLDAIVEAKEATEDQLAIDLCNSGVMAFDGAALWGLLDRIGNDNAKGEYYLTDAVALARRDGRTCAVVEGDEDEFLGVNSRVELAGAEAIVQRRLRTRAMENGATLLDPDTTYFSFDTELGQDVVVGPNVFFGPGVKVEDNADIKAFCHLEGAHVGAGVSVGPYARLRPGADIGARARIGNFVEVKKATVETGAKVNHLSYIGDARVGQGANIGAGTITCNYDGFLKSVTDIGAGAFIGSNTALVAPVRVGDGAIVGAGSTITRDVPADAIAVTRSNQKHLENAAETFRERRRDKKAQLLAEKTKKDG